MKSTTKTQKYPLWKVLPAAYRGFQVNGCRTPGCQNFGVRPIVTPGIPDPNYRAERSGGSFRLRCNACTRRFAIFNTRSLVVELDRLESRNGALLVPGCPKASCVNFEKSVTAHPRLYSRFGRNATGRPRVRCGRCGTVFVFEDEHRSVQRKRINKPLVRLFTNGVAIRGQARVAGVEIATIYRRLPFIWKKMQAFEEYKLQKFFAMRKNQQIRLHLCTDGQDQLVNWWSRDRRDPVQLSCITTAENLSGFVFRTDINFDGSTGNAGQHFEDLWNSGDYRLPDTQALHDRYEEKAFLKAVLWNLERELGAVEGALLSPQGSASAIPTLLARRRSLQAHIRNALALYDATGVTTLADMEGAPPDGVVTKRSYTALAHFAALHRLLPPEARLHVTTDIDATLIATALVAFVDRHGDNHLNRTSVTFDKEMKIDRKDEKIGAYRQRLAAFVRRHRLQGEDPILVRQAFIGTYAQQLPGFAGIAADFWSVPVQTRYEPDKQVGLVVERKRSTADRQTWQRWELLDRASMHATDTFFNWTRRRVSYMSRSADTRAGPASYAPRRPYRPDMLQMVLDVTRVYYNWCEPRRRRKRNEDISADAPLSLTKASPPQARPRPILPEHLEPSAFKVPDDGKARTPAMRLGLARAPTRLDTILYGNWLR